MAILIKQKEDKKITLINAGVEITEVYARYDWHPDMEGKKVVCRVLFFKDKAKWLEHLILQKQGKGATNIYTDIPAGLRIEIPTGTEPSIDFVENKLIEAYSSMGYDASKYIEE